MDLKKQTPTREIKFRAWILDEKQMLNNGNWFMLDLTYPSHTIQYADQGFYVNNAKAEGEHLEHLKKHNIKPEDEFVLMQYTGLKDKNGKEIYEGDIIGGYPHGTIEVRWSNEWGSWIAYNEVDDWTIEDELVKMPNYSLLSNDLDDCSDAWEVIGNIFENPELLQS